MAIPPTSPGVGPGARGWLRGPYRAETVLLACAAWIALTQNVALARMVLDSMPQVWLPRDMRFVATLPFLVTALLAFVLAPLTVSRLLKPVLVVILLAAGVCGYFMDTFGVVISDSMIANAMETDRREAGELLTIAFFLQVFLRGVLPAVLVARVQIVPTPLLRGLLRRLAFMAAALVVVLILVGVQYKSFTLWGRAHRDVRMYVNPTYPFYSLVKYFKGRAPADKTRVVAPIATDAVRAATGARPLLVVLVVGETARAANFQLDGYERATNPQLSKVPDLVSFTEVRSCGTATAESLPCMFSNLGRRDFTVARAGSRENVLDVLKRAGVRVAWRDNNAGCKHVCDRVEYTSVTDAPDPGLCDGGECFDETLTKGLDAWLPPAAGAATLLVLHQKGSHGPAYYLRYPRQYQVFTPDCRVDDVQQCPREQIVNAYDNTIVYTDFVLARLIDELGALQDRADAVLLYVSDHGESLGENGVYLHGLPYSLAPVEQVHIPMVLWMTPGAAASLHVDRACLAGRRDTPLSHDHLFHSLLGVLGVKTTAYDAQLDLFAPCQEKGSE